MQPTGNNICVLTANTLECYSTKRSRSSRRANIFAMSWPGLFSSSGACFRTPATYAPGGTRSERPKRCEHRYSGIGTSQVTRSMITTCWSCFGPGESALCHSTQNIASHVVSGRHRWKESGRECIFHESWRLRTGQ
jgi:hypothetical protein